MFAHVLIWTTNSTKCMVCT